MASHTQAEVEEPESGFAGFSTLSILRTIWKRKIRITVAWVLFASLCGRRGAHATGGVPGGDGGTDRLAKDPGLLHNSTGKTWSATLKQKWKSRNQASPGRSEEHTAE